MNKFSIDSFFWHEPCGHRGAQRSNSGLSDRMSRSEIVLLPCVLPTASQVLTTDTKITKSEVKIFNFIADDGFQAAAGGLLPTVWHRCAGCFLADGGRSYCSGALKLDTSTRGCAGRATLRA